MKAPHPPHFHDSAWAPIPLTTKTPGQRETLCISRHRHGIAYAAGAMVGCCVCDGSIWVQVGRRLYEMPSSDM